MRIYYKCSHDKEFHVLEAPHDGCWIHFDGALPEDLPQIAELSGLEPLALHDCLDKYEVPRVEKIEQTILIITRHPSEHEAGLYTTTFSMILCPHYFISISPETSSLVQHYVEFPQKVSTSQKSKLLISLLLKIAHDFTSQIKRVRFNVLKQEREMAGVKSEDIIALTKNEDILNQFLSTLVPLRAVLENITSGKYVTLKERDQELVEDLLNASKQSEILCNVNLKSIRSLRDSFQIIFTNNVTKTIKLLTALTIIFSIPTVLSSLYGMNLPLPLANSSFSFLYVLGMIVVFSIFSLIYFRKKEWL